MHPTLADEMHASLALDVGRRSVTVRTCAACASRSITLLSHHPNPQLCRLPPGHASADARRGADAWDGVAGALTWTGVHFQNLVRFAQGI